ncbi:hypothetical protein Acry_1251 [Acidiphilium cryptum JF-5]|uniref:Uncharacterized protein n=1 Tax=Acidiphilium cryptum (strain JF-5) TaxID=349163 RepID=A5FXY0_ACICJ|nr:hypothetical protein Acry_1251 [Acidiphilium cryptum JF-5]
MTISQKRYFRFIPSIDVMGNNESYACQNRPTHRRAKTCKGGRKSRNRCPKVKPKNSASNGQQRKAQLASRKMNVSKRFVT